LPFGVAAISAGVPLAVGMTDANMRHGKALKSSTPLSV
jgi:hypothetical protein